MEKNISLQNSVFLTGVFVLLIWSIKLGETVLGVNLYQLGVHPQALSGLIGVITAPLIHGSWQHVLGNTLPILLLGSIFFYGYPKSRWWALGIIWLLSGLGVWLFARSTYHIGASGLTHGLFFYLFIGGILRRDKRSSALLMVAFYMYGTMLLSIFPWDADVSFEYHLFGALSGAACAIGFRRWDPKPEKKIYSWELEGSEDGVEDDNDSDVGDEWKGERRPPGPPG